jgi:hypothetical protein
MNKPVAVIDKSLLQAICEQGLQKRNASFKALFERYQVVVASVLIEEVWVNLAKPGGRTPAAALENMIDFLIRQHGSWIAEPLEIAFLELVKGESIKPLPQPPASLVHSFSVLRRDNPALVKWEKERAALTESNVRQRVRMHAEILSPNTFAPVKSGREFFERFIRPKFAEMLSDPVRKRKLLERELGLAFRAEHPECSKEIAEAFNSYSPETFEKYQATLMCIIAGMFYFYGPLCKMVSPDGGDPAVRILGRGFGDQSNHLADQRYVQSALLCDRLLTRDKGMHNVMKLLKDCGFWDGISVFLDPKKDIETQISKNLICCGPIRGLCRRAWKP